MKKIYIVMPVANEEDNIEKLIHNIFNQKIPELFLVLIIDKFSKDNTKNIIIKAQKEFKSLFLLDYTKSTGVVSCYLHGFEFALSNNADYIIEMDAGNSHDPDEIPNFIESLDQGYDCVFGSRFITKGKIINMPLYRKLISKLGTNIANIVLGTKFTDMTSGFEAFKKQVLNGFDFDSFLSLQTTHFMQTEIRYYCRNMRYKEIPIVYIGSKSGLNIKGLLKSFKILFRLKKEKPKTKFKTKRSIIK